MKKYLKRMFRLELCFDLKAVFPFDRSFEWKINVSACLLDLYISLTIRHISIIYMVSSITNCLHRLHSIEIVWHSPCQSPTPLKISLSLTNFVLSRLLQSRYITSMYFIFTTLTSVGFGNVAPNSSLEKLTSIMVMLLGCKSLLLSNHQLEVPM